MRFPLTLLIGSLAAACATLSVPDNAEQEIAALDERQKQMVSAADVDALAALAHPDLRINAPTGRVLTREEFLAMMRDGRIKAEQFERVAESVTVSGPYAAVMGRETFTPSPDSELGQMYGAAPLQRRYTNYVWEHGAWKWLTRHANVVEAR